MKRQHKWQKITQKMIRAVSLKAGLPLILGMGILLWALPVLAQVWTYTDSMGTDRKNATITRLQDGRLLIVGGVVSPGIVEGDQTNYLSTAEIYDPETCQFIPTGSLTTGSRALHTATLLPDGKVLVAGGYRGEGASYGLATAELYDPATLSFTATGSLNYGRGMHTATLLDDGTVLIVGGYNTAVSTEVSEIYDPLTGTFALGATMSTKRNGHRATKLQNGNVLITGGFDPTNNQNTAEVYDYLAGSFFSTSNTMFTPKSQHTSTLLPSGSVLITGGTSGTGTAPLSVTATVEVYSPVSNSFGLYINGLNTARQYHSAILLPDGRVLIAGGNSDTAWGFHWTFGYLLAQKALFLNSAEVWDPSTISSTYISSMDTGRNGFDLALIENGDVLATGGGYDSAELFAEDSDSDGVCDTCDGCPYDASKISPGLCGCGVSDIDSDSDGTPNCNDTDDDNDCYKDAVEIAEGTNSLDASDFPPDLDDDCLTDLQEQSMDSDGDEIVNFDDNCQETPNPISSWTDINGQSHVDEQADYDLDGVGDACDNCEYIPNGLLLGTCTVGSNADASCNIPGDNTSECGTGGFCSMSQDDGDDDHVGDACDNAPGDWNPEQEDYDSDGLPDVLDNCPQKANGLLLGTCTAGSNAGVECNNPGSNTSECGTDGYCSMNQEDADTDGRGDACDGDYSYKRSPDPEPPPEECDGGDGYPDDVDNCPCVVNGDQTNTDQAPDGGDACDLDDDNDGVPDLEDSCPLLVNVGDPDGDDIDSACDPDDDEDGILDGCDVSNNPGAADSDGDEVIDSCDNCINDHNPFQEDDDSNGIGNACEPEHRFKFTLSDPGTPDNDIYNTWLPEDGRRAIIKAELVDIDGNILVESGSIILTQMDSVTSNICGKYTNDSSEDCTNPAYDYTVENDGTPIITITSHDFGGKTVIMAQTMYNGQPITGFHRIPKDSDDDGLPDAFEQDENLNPSGKLDPFKIDSDGDDVPDGLEDAEGTENQDPGDGNTAFEEYRGVWWNETHHRLSTERKDLFVVAVDFDDELAPFAVGAAFEEAGVDVYSVQTTNDGSQWNQINKNFEDNNLDYLIIRSYDSGWSDGDYNSGHVRWIGVRTWDIPVLGESYFGDKPYFGQPTKIFRKSIENYFNDGPYRDGGALCGLEPYNGGPVVPPDGYLNPLLDVTVEDQDDDGYPDKKEDDNDTGTLDGDMRVTNVSTWADDGRLNPFNINNNDLVELPQKNRKDDPYTYPSSDLSSVEYGKAIVFRHVITHEIGHSVGMGQGDPGLVDNLGHCFDPTCVMYKNSISWDRDGHFCPYHQQLIQIDNNFKTNNF